MPETTAATSPKKSLLGNIIKLIVFLGIGFFFIYWFLLKLDAEQKQAIWDSFTHANYFWVAMVMLCVMLAHFVRALRWRLLYEPMGYRPGLNNTFGAVVVTYMANLAFPRLGEVLRCALLRTSDNIPVQKSLGTVVTERCFDILAFGVVVLIGLLFMYGQAKEWLVDVLQQKSQGLPGLATVAIVLIAAIVLIVVLYRLLRNKMIKFKPFRKIDDIIQGGLDGLKSIFHLSPRSMVLFILHSILIYLFYIAGGVVILQAFPETADLGFGAAFVLYLFGSIGMTISQGGLGAYPALVMEALALYGIGQTVGLAAGWLLWASQQAIVIVVGLAYLVYFSLVKKKAKVQPSTQVKNNL
ncbi:MAG: flippase-like domain-containing protein [Bacteroidales bacterium]|nr:flippase-like domain-containing protein [Bacteroidales bacterium]